MFNYRDNNQLLLSDLPLRNRVFAHFSTDIAELSERFTNSKYISDDSTLVINNHPRFVGHDTSKIGVSDSNDPRVTSGTMTPDEMSFQLELLRRSNLGIIMTVYTGMVGNSFVNDDKSVVSKFLVANKNIPFSTLICFDHPRVGLQSFHQQDYTRYLGASTIRLYEFR
jgi:hypothetical protein